MQGDQAPKSKLLKSNTNIERASAVDIDIFVVGVVARDRTDVVVDDGIEEASRTGDAHVIPGIRVGYNNDGLSSVLVGRTTGRAQQKGQHT